MGFSGDSDGKESTCNAGDTPGPSLDPGGSFEEGNGYPFQYSCLENFMDRGAWQATYSPWCAKESDTSEGLSLSLFII